MHNFLLSDRRGKPFDELKSTSQTGTMDILEFRRDPIQRRRYRLLVALLLCAAWCLDQDSVFGLTSDGSHRALSTGRSRGDGALSAASSFIVELLHELRLDSLLSLVPPRLLLGQLGLYVLHALLGQLVVGDLVG